MSTSRSDVGSTGLAQNQDDCDRRNNNGQCQLELAHDLSHFLQDNVQQQSFVKLSGYLEKTSDSRDKAFFSRFAKKADAAH